MSRFSASLSHHISIANHKKMRIHAITFLNHHLGSDAHLSLFTIFLPPYAIASNTILNPNTYNNKCIDPAIKSSHDWRILLTSKAYVGEQPLNTGHNTNHNKISHFVPILVDHWALLVTASIRVTCMILVQIWGNNKTRPNNIKIHAETAMRDFWLTPNLDTSRCRMRVNTIMLIANDKMISRGRDFLPSITDHQMMTGNIGNTHGASTVKIHAMSERKYKDIV